MIIVVVVVGLAAATWLTWRLDVPAAGGRDTARPISVIVPARNEAAALPTLLGSLGRLDPAPHEVIVVDDDSTDATSAIAAAHGATVIRTAPPVGWLGKPWACHVGAQAASGTHLLFLDADTWLAPVALDALLAEQTRRGGLVSVQPHHVTQRPYEELSAYCNAVAVMGTGAFALRARTAARSAFGPCLLTSAADYARAGGHDAVRTEIVEDIQLARHYRAAGLPVMCFAGGELVRFRMYPGGIRQLVDGWSKNLALGASTAPALAVTGTVAWVAAHVTAAAGLAVGLTEWIRRTGPAPVAPLVAAVAVAAHQRWLLHRIGTFRWWTAVAFPVPLLGFLAIFGRSAALLVLRRDVDWRERRVAVRRRP